jgi:hypothetical protein
MARRAGMTRILDAAHMQNRILSGRQGRAHSAEGTVPLDIRLGEVVPIPCRHCGRFFRTPAANQFIKCPACEGLTVVRVGASAGRILVYTEAATAGQPVRPAR